MLILTGGDPLMRPDVLDLAREASDLGLHLGLSPSGTARLVNADFQEFLDAGIMRISLSLDGATEESHDTFRGLRGTFARTMKAIEKAHAVGLDVQINTTLTRGNLHEFPAFRELMFVLKPAMWSVFVVVPTGRAGLADMPSAEDLEEVFMSFRHSCSPGPCEAPPNSEMSAPAMNARPSPCSTMAFTASSAIAAFMPSKSPWRTPLESGFTGGLSMRRTASSPSTE